MGQKVHPMGIRLGIIRDSNACWYSNSDTFADTLRSDIEIRQYISKTLPESANISKVLLKRTGLESK